MPKNEQDTVRKILFISAQPFPPLVQSLNINFAHVRVLETHSISDKTIPRSLEENVIVVFNDLNAVGQARKLSDQMKSLAKLNLVAVITDTTEHGLAYGKGARVVFADENKVVAHIKSINGTL